MGTQPLAPASSSSSPPGLGTSGSWRAGHRQLLELSSLLLLASLVVLAAHWPVLSARAFTFDDQQYLTNNPLVRHPSWDSVGRFFAEVLEPSTVRGYYQPLAMISLMVDWALGGRIDNLRPFHATSLLLHILNTALIIVLLCQLFGQPWAAVLVGLLFGVHPLTVEPVAWVSERKTLLAAFFSLWSLVFYVSWVDRPRWTTYGAALSAFILALLSKPTATPLPALLLLLDYWPLRRLRWRAAPEKIPFLIVAGVSAVITFISQARGAGVGMPHERPLAQTLLTLCHNVVFYLCKIVWPANLSAHYPFPEPFGLSSPMVLAGVIGTPLLLAALLVSWRWTRAALVGGMFFLVAILPTMGIVAVTGAIAASKYAYLPIVGLLLIPAYLLARRWPPRLRSGSVLPRRTPLVLAGALLVAAALGILGTRRQLVVWQNTERLYRHMLRLAPQVAMLHSDLADELSRQRRFDEAIEAYHQALRRDPAFYNAHNGLGLALLEQGRVAEAIGHFQAALRINPRLGAAYSGLGTALVRQGRLDEAFDCFAKALQLDPHVAEVHCNMGAILAQRGQYAQAIERYTEALRLKPELTRARHNLGVALVRLGRLDEAAGCFEEALRFERDYLPAYVNLALVRLAQNRLDEAVRACQAGLRVAPDDPRLRDALRAAQARRAVGPQKDSRPEQASGLPGVSE